MKTYGLCPHEKGMSYQVVDPQKYDLLLNNFPEHEGPFDVQETKEPGKLQEAKRNFTRWFYKQRKDAFFNYLKSLCTMNEATIGRYLNLVIDRLYAPTLIPFPEEEYSTTKNPAHAAKHHFSVGFINSTIPQEQQLPPLKPQIQLPITPVVPAISNRSLNEPSADDGSLQIRRELLKKDEEYNWLADDFRSLDRKLDNAVDELATVGQQLVERKAELNTSSLLVEETKAKLAQARDEKDLALRDIANLEDELQLERQQRQEIELKYRNCSSWIENHRVSSVMNPLMVILLFLVVLLLAYQLLSTIQ